MDDKKLFDDLELLEDEEVSEELVAEFADGREGDEPEVEGDEE